VDDHNQERGIMSSEFYVPPVVPAYRHMEAAVEAAIHGDSAECLAQTVEGLRCWVAARCMDAADEARAAATIAELTGR